MFMQPPGVCQTENVCWLVSQEPTCYKRLYRSAFAAKVRCDTWAQKEGCCKTIGPPPKLCFNCPAHYLKKHSRTVPVYFKPEELRVSKKDKKSFEYRGAGLQVAESENDVELPPLNSDLPKPRTRCKDECKYPKPPSRMGLFRSPKEPPYEVRYKLRMPRDCDCDQIMWEELINATEQAGRMAAETDKKRGKNKQGDSHGPPKDYIRSNALHAIRMPPRRLRRCYVDKCGVHLIDMSDSPYVLRPGFGKVPAYIYRRKWELLQDDIRTKQEMEDRAMQDYEPVQDLEREMVITGLKDYWGRLLQEYNALPLNGSENERHRELKHNLEERMKEVEADLKLLNSTNMLYVGDVVSSHYL